MILIYSRDTDDFVNDVIDCLNTDLIRIGDRDPILIEKVGLNKSTDIFLVENDNMSLTDLIDVNSIWFNGGVANTNGSDYENKCYINLIDSFLSYHPSLKLGRISHGFELNKLDLTLMAKRIGLCTPRTLITGNKNELMNFYKYHYKKNGIICKRILDEYFYENNDFVYDFTNTFIINDEIVKAIPDDFAISLFQERIMAEFEIRVVFISGNIYCASIHCFDDDVDYRKKINSTKDIRIVPFYLPEEVSDKVIKMFNVIDLNYGSMDLIFDGDNYYFLEINPIGQVSFINEKCNFYLENTVATFLKNEA